MHTFQAEVEKVNTLPFHFSFHTLYRCPFQAVPNATFSHFCASFKWAKHSVEAFLVLLSTEGCDVP